MKTHPQIPGQMRIDLPTGNFNLLGRIASPDYASIAETNVTVSDHEVSGVELRFAPIPAIPVELIVDPSSTSDNTVPVLPQFGLSLQNTDPSGDIGYPGVQMISRREAPAILNAPPGTYRLQARNANEWYIKSATYGSSDLLRQNLVVAAGSGGVPIRLIVSNLTGSLQGTTRINGISGEAWIYLISSGPSATPVLTFRSNSDGTFNLPHLAPGSYQVIAFENRYSADFSDPATIAPFNAQVESASISAGNKSTIEIDVVPQSAITP